MNENERTRAKILGVLIQDARLHAGRAVDACAQVLGLEPEEFSQAEAGERVLSLPHLEVLALFLDVPLAHFWGTEVIGQKKTIRFDDMLALRQRVVGALLQARRQESGQSPADLAQAAGIETSDLEAYEAGQRPIPLFVLEKLGQTLDISLSHFLDLDHGPLAQHEEEHKVARRFLDLPPEMQAFITEPVNIAYLKTAMRLSEMSADKLRTIAESILDITY